MKESKKQVDASGCCGGKPSPSRDQTRSGDRPDGTLPGDPEAIVEKVREKYGQIADSATAGCCGPDPGAASLNAGRTAEKIGYEPDDLGAVPDGTNLGLGCGAPVPYLDLQPGETVLDLGAGAGVDVFIAARHVGPAGKAIGVDMTPEMVVRAQGNADQSGLFNVEFREGRLEALPVDDESVDAVTSNCVINLVPDKSRVFCEVSRVLRPGGRMVISDIVLDGHLPEAIRSDLLAYVGCVAGAMQRDDYFAAVEAAGLSNIEVLEDIDVVAAGCVVGSGRAATFSERYGVSVDDIRGKVHSVTYRAVKR
jgi:SAM-dependent methyltransferase